MVSERARLIIIGHNVGAGNSGSGHWQRQGNQNFVRHPHQPFSQLTLQGQRQASMMIVSQERLYIEMLLPGPGTIRKHASIVDGGFMRAELFRLKASLFTPTLMALTTSYARTPIGFRPWDKGRL